MTNSNDDNKDLQLVPETILKKRHDLDDLKRKRAAQVRISNKVFSKSSTSYVRKPETYIARAKSARNHEIRYKRVLKKGMQKRASNKKEFKMMQVEDAAGEEQEIKYQHNSIESKMVFVVRIRDDVGVSPKVRRNLQRLGLQKQYEGIFMKYTPIVRRQLHLMDPWIVYGPLSKGMISDLINRRGHGRVNGDRTPLTDNTIIEEALGAASGIICVEDLVHELHSGGEQFKEASGFLWPFSLSAPKTRFETQKLDDKEGKIYGDRGEEIEKLVKQML